MNTQPDDTDRVTDRDLLEATPSTGYRETDDIFHVGEHIEAFACGATGCHTDEDLRRVTKDGRRRVLCPDHARDFLEATA